jgi:hypothetical protein
MWKIKLSRTQSRLSRRSNIVQSKLVEEALPLWLERQEELEDLAAIAEVEGEPTIPWEQVKAELQAMWDDKANDTRRITAHCR